MLDYESRAASETALDGIRRHSDNYIKYAIRRIQADFKAGVAEYGESHGHPRYAI